MAPYQPAYVPLLLDLQGTGSAKEETVKIVGGLHPSSVDANPGRRRGCRGFLGSYKCPEPEDFKPSTLDLWACSLPPPCYPLAPHELA